MTDNEAKARAKLAEAEKKGKKGGFFGLFGGGASDDTANLYIQVSSPLNYN